MLKTAQYLCFVLMMLTLVVTVVPEIYKTIKKQNAELSESFSTEKNDLVLDDNEANESDILIEPVKQAQLNFISTKKHTIALCNCVKGPVIGLNKPPPQN